MATSPLQIADVLDLGADVPAAAAQYLLSLTFTPQVVARAEELSYKAQENPLTPSERDELGQLLHLDSLLSVIHSKARQTLRTQGSAA